MTDGDREDDYDHDEDEDEDVPQVAALDVLLHTVKGHVRRVERAVKSAPHVHPLSKGLAFSLAFPPLGRAAGHKWSGTRARGREGLPMNDWPTVEVAVKRLGWERWLWNGGQGRWKRESEWSKGEAWVAEMKEDSNDLFWWGPCPITGKGEPPRDGGRARPASHARNGVLLHCDPCQQEFGVGKLEDIPDTRRDYWAHHRKLMARGR